MLAGTDDHLTRLSPVILNLENTGLTHLEPEIRVDKEVGHVLVSFVQDTGRLRQKSQRQRDHLEVMCRAYLNSVTFICRTSSHTSMIRKPGYPFLQPILMIPRLRFKRICTVLLLGTVKTSC